MRQKAFYLIWVPVVLMILCLAPNGALAVNLSGDAVVKGKGGSI